VVESNNCCQIFGDGIMAVFSSEKQIRRYSLASRYDSSLDQNIKEMSIIRVNF
jgi:hypothetical protein